MSDSPQAIAIPGKHNLLMKVVQRYVPPAETIKVLDLGAGEGAFSQKLDDAGYEVAACDLFPEMFRYSKVECRKADLHEPLPYDDGEFDLVIAVEVMEHLENHLRLFKDISRILKPGGTFMFSTPNIMSLKSRMRFLFSGFFYSHGPLEPGVDEPVHQHIAAFTPNRYRFILEKAGLELTNIDTDKYQKYSQLMCWLAPFIRFYTKKKFGTELTQFENCPAALYGRTMVGVSTKK
ncbi:MAG: class I SAM-dependent methyltransferase [Planctomycetaceae bacterium]|nr:class I SAM-dependent methyltransferase [Planctomycetaceae bacterium]